MKASDWWNGKGFDGKKGLNESMAFLFNLVLLMGINQLILNGISFSWIFLDFKWKNVATCS